MPKYLESDVGMTEYIGSHQGFSAILKLRFKDFLVNEINKFGNILHLSDTTYKEPVNVAQKACSQVSVCEDADSLISKDEQLMLKKLEDDELSSSFVLINAGNDKATRTKIHELIRQLYPSLDSETFDDKSGVKKIKVSRISLNGKRKRNAFSKQKKSITQFLLYKENISTMDAVNLLLKKLHLNYSKCFQYAGNKDKRAVTVQAMTTTVSIQRLISVNKFLRNIRVGNFSPCEKHLQLGDLKGNRFAIVLRNIEKEKNVIEEAVSNFSTIGFINYYGMQRFGTSDALTYEIGRALLASKWDKAIDLILSAISEKDGDVIKLASAWREEGNASRAYQLMRRKSSFEGFLLRGIDQFGTKQLVQALTRIPRPTRLLYLHSYQSYLWNRVVSRRLREFGAVPVVGDLVIAEERSTEPNDDVDDSNDVSDEREQKKQKLDVSASARSLPRVKLLTQDDLPNYKITDVVFPLPGHEVVYPGNSRDQYRELLQEDGIELEAFDHRVKDYRLSGAYRSIIVRPFNVRWDVVGYDDLDKPLLVTDLEKMDGETDILSCDGRFQALRLHFDLPPSSYATVAMREITKTDMSITSQSMLGDSHRRSAHELLHAHEESSANDQSSTPDKSSNQEKSSNHEISHKQLSQSHESSVQSASESCESSPAARESALTDLTGCDS